MNELERLFQAGDFSAPSLRKSRTIELAANHKLVEFGFDALPGGPRWRLLRTCANMYNNCGFGVRKLIRQHNVDIIRASDPYWSGFLVESAQSAKHFCVSLHSDYGREEI